MYTQSLEVDDMLVNFIGSPASGKTTTAAMLFATLKERGLAVEFITEVARYYIAERKFFLALENLEMPVLYDLDQCKIMDRQYRTEYTMVINGGRDSLIISDGSPLNSLLYMTPEFRQNPLIQDLVERTKRLMEGPCGLPKSLTFICAPVDRDRNIPDPNRAHDLEQIKKIDSQLIDVMNQTGLGLLTEPGVFLEALGEWKEARWIWLTGDTQRRLTDALEWVYRRLCE